MKKSCSAVRQGVRAHDQVGHDAAAAVDHAAAVGAVRLAAARCPRPSRRAPACRPPRPARPPAAPRDRPRACGPSGWSAPTGVYQRPVVIFRKLPPESGKSVCTEPLPKVGTPSTSARSWSCSAPDDDLRRARRVLVDQHHDRQARRAPPAARRAKVSLSRASRPRVSTIGCPGFRKRSETETPWSSRPPGLVRRSRISPFIPCCRSRSIACAELLRGGLGEDVQPHAARCPAPPCRRSAPTARGSRRARCVKGIGSSTPTRAILMFTGVPFGPAQHASPRPRRSTPRSTSPPPPRCGRRPACPARSAGVPGQRRDHRDPAVLLGDLDAQAAVLAASSGRAGRCTPPRVMKAVCGSPSSWSIPSTAIW